MEASHQLILAGAALVAFSILLGQLSTRFGAPLLLVFLAIGMLAGEDGPGGILFSDYGAAFIIGSLALAVILFDGGLRTSRDTLRLALGPAVALASVGVAITAVLVGLVAALLLDFSWPAALLIGSIVASTDAAAVFALLRLKGMDVQRRTAATLEAESGLNDPVAVFLTVLFTEYLIAADGPGLGEVVLRLVLQMAGGAVIGVAGGHLLTRLINRLSLAAGLYPILALSLALVIFGGALAVGASGFLAIYAAGVVLGNSRHREAVSIDRFHDGMAWLAQIALFLMLGLLVTPHDLLRGWDVALALSLVLMLVARPLAVALCLLPFRFTWQEIVFIGWVGLRGAVPIYLATIPILAGAPNATIYLNLAFVAVLTSLVLQGWSVAWFARALGLELPPKPERPLRQELGLPGAGADLVIAAYEVPAEAFDRAVAALGGCAHSPGDPQRARPPSARAGAAGAGRHRAGAWAGGRAGDAGPHLRRARAAGGGGGHGLRRVHLGRLRAGQGAGLALWAAHPRRRRAIDARRFRGGPARQGADRGRPLVAR
jgi:cell volume regulation protein A